MKMPPEERPKAIALAVAIVMVLCLFGVKVVPRLLPHGPNGELLIGASASSSTPASSTSTHVAATAPAAMTAPVPLTTALGASGTAAPPLSGSLTAIDPFWRPLAISQQKQKAGYVPPGPIINSASKGPTDPAKLGWPAGGGGPMGVKPITVQPLPTPEIELQGIVQDETAMAVLNVGGQARFLKAGERLESDWVVYRIQTATVILKQGRRQVMLNLGQSLPKDPLPQENAQEIPSAHRIAETPPPYHNVMLQP